ncbi:MAG: hypothetical protein CVU69_05065 [Deltaproteobacteria bacterium HGW-Deltaproteobacteria-4]|nr:MAG: hypothetical protein CVU69_05065 [Deltaproteobacteria bacterium HGW-Deltaproteobacteria-4]
MKKILEEWEEIKAETVADLTTRLKPNISELCPPVILALDTLRLPQAGIAAVLKTKQPRISLFRQGKRQMTITEQERLCDLVDAMIEKNELDFSAALKAIVEPVESGEIAGWKECVRIQIDYARVMNTIQRAIIKKRKG